MKSNNAIEWTNSQKYFGVLKCLKLLEVFENPIRSVLVLLGLNAFENLALKQHVYSTHAGGWRSGERGNQGWHTGGQNPEVHTQLLNNPASGKLPLITSAWERTEQSGLNPTIGSSSMASCSVHTEPATGQALQLSIFIVSRFADQ